MSAGLPSIAKPKPNPNWARLPLFDRKNWSRVRFGDVVENLNATCDPTEARPARFIGLEHLEPGSLHIRTWGNVADGTTFTRRCRPGQMLFGKRRAYQRKVAVAEFDAVVSGDIYVFAPTGDRLLPALLPFLCLSERFFQHAVGTSAGSLSPRTNWTSLAKFELDLPPLDQQRRITDLLLATDHSLVTTEALSQAVTAIYNSRSDALFRDLTSTSTPLGALAAQGIVEMQTGPFGTVLAASSYRKTGVPILNPVHMNGDTFDVGGGPFISEIEANRLSRYLVREGDIVLCRKRHVGRMVYALPEHAGFVVGSDCIRFRTNPAVLNSKFLLLFMRSPSVQSWLIRATTGTVMPGISEAALSKLEPPLPSPEAQANVVSALEEILDLRAAVTTEFSAVKRLRTALVEAVLPGEPRHES